MTSDFGRGSDIGFGIYQVSRSNFHSPPGFKYSVLCGEKVIAYLDCKSRAQILAGTLRLAELIDDIGDNLSEEVLALAVDLFGVIRNGKHSKK